jgi:class 3 adenylate cyclase
MKCPKCQHENPDGQKFCGECGYNITLSLTQSSPALSFDEKLAKIQRYLPEGLTEKVLSQKDKIEGERKKVTVMFCDMEGFTPLVETLGPEAAYSVMDQVYEILIHQVHDLEGTVNEMTGDGIMALFGAPIALEDAPQRALWAALSIHREIAKFNEQKARTDPIRMRIGIHTGPVVVGTLGNDLRVEFKAVGDTVNLASRMEGLAEPGTTFVTEDIYKLTKELFRFEPLGERAVKGKTSVVPVYKLLSSKVEAHRPRLGLERSIYSEMVGRDTELEQLELQVLKTAQGEGSIVNIIGEAGIGKSRLVAELKKRDVIKKVNLFEGRAISTGRNLSFHPIIDLLKHWARIGEDDGGAVALRKLETAIKRVYPQGVHEVLPFVATLMGMRLTGRYAERVKGIEGEALEKLILKNMRDLLIKATELKPQVIVTEDLHWADTSSIELMESLFRLAETQRILFINVFRPDHKETGDRITKTTKERFPKYYIEIMLEPLDERMSETLIDNMLHIKGLKHAVIDQIVARADGNPFFIEEVVRSFIDEGAIMQKDGAFEVTEKIDEMVIPHTISDVLMARIDRLDEETRNLVKVASVIGRSFFYRILKEMTKSIKDIDDRLSYLQEIQLFRERKRMEEIEYLFKHALAQEAAYESILLQTRRELHLKVADAIEKVFKIRLHEFYGMLAYHYSQGEDLDKAEEYMIKAGEEALGSSASREALHYYQEALRLYLDKHGEKADPEKLAMLEKNIALALFNKGEHPDALVYFDRVLKRWGIKAPQNKILMLIKLLFDLFIVLLNMSFPSKKSRKIPDNRDNEIFDLSYKRNQTLVMINPLRTFVEQIGTIKRALRFDIEKIGNGVHVIVNGSATFSWIGCFRLSNKFLRYSEGLIEKKNFRERFAYVVFRFLHDFFSGNWSDIQDYDEFLVDQNLKVGQLWEVTIYFCPYGSVKMSQGEFRSAYLILEKISEIAEGYEYEMARGWQLFMETALHLEYRNLYDAQKSVEKLESNTVITGSEMFHLMSLGLEAQIQILSEDLDGAEKSLSQAEYCFRKQDIVPAMFASEYLLSRFFFDIRLLEESLLSNDKSLISKHRKNACKSGKNALRNSKKYALLRLEALRLVGLYHWLIGKQNKAVKWWGKTIEEGERLGARPELARTYMEIGKRFLEEKSKYKELGGISAKEYLEKARAMFQEMDLQWDLDALDKVRNEVPQMPSRNH